MLRLISSHIDCVKLFIFIAGKRLLVEILASSNTDLSLLYSVSVRAFADVKVLVELRLQSFKYSGR